MFRLSFPSLLIRTLRATNIFPKSRYRTCSTPLLSIQPLTVFLSIPSFDTLATMKGKKMKVFLALWENVYMCQNRFRSTSFYLIIAGEAGDKSSSLRWNTSCHYKYCEMIMQDCPKFGKALKNFHVCMQMFNPWKKSVRKKVSDLGSIADLGSGLRTELSIALRLSSPSNTTSVI